MFDGHDLRQQLLRKNRLVLSTILINCVCIPILILIYDVIWKDNVELHFFVNIQLARFMGKNYRVLLMFYIFFCI